MQNVKNNVEKMYILLNIIGKTARFYDDYVDRKWYKE